MSSTDVDLDDTVSVDDLEEERAGNSNGELGPQSQTKQTFEMRARINHRERRRMHDLNQAMDALREVMPYAHGPSVRKLSKIATISLARNYILMLTKSVDDLKHMLDDAYRSRCMYGYRNSMVPSLQHPGNWNLGPHDNRGYASFHRCSSNMYASCGNSLDNVYACCSIYANNLGTSSNLNKETVTQESHSSAHGSIRR